MKSEDNLSANQRDQLKFIGERLKSLRTKKGYTSYENFAFDHGLNRANYGRYEKGANLKVATLIKILECHNLSLEEFYKLDNL